MISPKPIEFLQLIPISSLSKNSSNIYLFKILISCAYYIIKNKSVFAIIIFQQS